MNYKKLIIMSIIVLVVTSVFFIIIKNNEYITSKVVLEIKEDLNITSIEEPNKSQENTSEDIDKEVILLNQTINNETIKNITEEKSISSGRGRGRSGTSPIISPQPPANNPPIFDNISNQNITVKNTLTFSVNATDPENDSLTFLVINLPANATFLNQTFNWTPTIDDIGIHNLTFIVSDGVHNVSQNVTINVLLNMSEISIIVGNHKLKANTSNQSIQIFVYSDIQVQGINFHIQIGGEQTIESCQEYLGPLISEVDILNNTIFDGVNTGSRGDSLPCITIRSTTTTVPPDYITANGLLATAYIDTTGFFNGTWELSMKNTLDGPTDFAGIYATIYDGSININ